MSGAGLRLAIARVRKSPHRNRLLARHECRPTRVSAPQGLSAMSQPMALDRRDQEFGEYRIPVPVKMPIELEV